MVLAAISGIFALASYSAQQRVIPRYQKVVAEYLEATVSADHSWKIEDMRRAEIAAKRLLIEDPSSPTRILLSARVGLASYASIRREIASQPPGDSQMTDELEELAIQANARAIQSMQRAARLEGAEALEARLWIRDWRFRSMRDHFTVSEGDSSDSMKEFSELLSLGAHAHLFGADVLIHQALRFPYAIDWSQSHSSMRKAKDILVQDQQSSLEKNASQVEVAAVLEPATAASDAIRFVSESVRDIKQIPWDWRAREAIFRLRLHMGSPAEAFDFAWTSLTDVPAAEREIFRWNVAASSLRAMVIQLHQSDPQAKRNVPLLFSFAVKFAPDSPQLVQVIRLLLENNVDAIGQDWLKAMMGGHEPGISDWIDWVRSVTAEDAIAAKKTPRELPRLDPSFVPGAMVAIRVARQRALVEHRTLTRMIDSLLEADPENASLQRLREELMNAKTSAPKALGAE